MLAWLRWIVLLCAVAAAVIVIAYPPWIYVHPSDSGLVEQLGYSPLNRPPSASAGVRINRVWLGIELGAVVGATVVLLILVWPEKSRHIPRQRS